MVSVLTRRTLARLAFALNACAGARHLPALILLTDAQRLADPWPSAQALPPGSAVILRATSAPARASLAARLMPLVRRRDLILLIADDPLLASRIGADGLHCSEAQLGAVVRWRTRRKDWLITAAAHSLPALRRAMVSGAHAVLLAPVFPTQSHPGRAALGPWRFRALAGAGPIPVYPLGGIDAYSAKRLVGARAAGIAAIGALRPGEG